jgi:hypothetical protein
MVAARFKKIGMACTAATLKLVSVSGVMAVPLALCAS